jgi:hypothetical protein
MQVVLIQRGVRQQGTALFVYVGQTKKSVHFGIPGQETDKLKDKEKTQCRDDVRGGENCGSDVDTIARRSYADVAKGGTSVDEKSSLITFYPKIET